MKIPKIWLTFSFILFAMFNCFAQEVDFTKGDLSVLKGETTINIEFTYEKMSVGDFNKEADYIKKKIEEQNAKDPPNGDNWAAEWQADKKTFYGDKFILGFTKQNKMSFSKSTSQFDC